MASTPMDQVVCSSYHQIGLYRLWPGDAICCRRQSDLHIDILLIFNVFALNDALQQGIATVEVRVRTVDIFED